MSVSYEQIKMVEKVLAKKYKVYLQLWPGQINGDLQLGYLEVPKINRKAGIGSKLMTTLCQYADQQNLRITLSPALKGNTMGTTSSARLVKFYKRFGFVLNKGRRSDLILSERMYRVPNQSPD